MVNLPSNRMAFLVEQQTFSGPLDLLLSLIEAKKLHVSEISLATVTDDFARYITEHQTDLGDRSRYVSILAMLLLIKARGLVPRMALADEEEQSIEDLTRALERLAVVRAAQRQLDQYRLKHESFLGAERPRGIVFAPGVDITLPALLAAAREVLEQQKKELGKEELPETRIRPTLTITDALERVREALTIGAGDFSMAESVRRVRTATKPEERYHAKVEAVVFFLALLEFVRQGMADIIESQHDVTGPHIRRSGEKTESVAK